MSEGIQTAEADRGQASRRPIWFLTAASLVTAAVLLASVWGSYDSYRSFGVVSQRSLRIQELRGQIIHLDEVLTMSARMAAASGAPRWEARYWRFEPQLAQAIEEAESLVSNVESTGQTDAANEALVALEERAFDLVRRGRLEQARAILSGEQYATHKATYAEGMARLGSQLQDAALSATRSQEERALLQLVAAAIALPLLVAGWLVVLRVTDRWRRDVVESHRQLVELNRSLDQKVEERTAALARATKQANAASEAKSAFLANMSHELRTPMNAIIGYSEMLMEDAEDLGQEEFVPDLQKIHGAGRHLLALINDVLDLSKIEAGKMEVHRERFALAEVVNEAVAMVTPQATQKGLSLETDCGDGVVQVYLDPGMCRQILLNLLSNAVKFTSGGGRVHVGSRRDGQDLVVHVSDTGMGIASEDAKKIFDEFYQVDGSYSRNYGGTGLGLALVRKMVEMQGGTIEVQSAPGEGTRFTLRFPGAVLAEQPAPPAESRAPTEVSVPAGPAEVVDRDWIILLVEDNPLNRKLARNVLRSQGFEVWEAPTGEDALNQLRRRRPDLILMDLQLPGMDGLEVTRRLKADPKTADLPVVALTAHVREADEQEAWEAGCVGYITKPIRLATFPGQVETFLTEPAPQLG